MATHAILPAEAGAEASANVIDIGANGNEFKSLYLNTSIICDSDFLIDAGGDIKLDAGGSDIRLEVAGTQFGKFTRSSGDFIISASENDKDMKFAGADGGSDITALTLDMSEGGEATFNDDINLGDSKRLRMGAGGDFEIFHDGSDNFIKGATSDQDIKFQGVDGGSTITALQLDMSAAGLATFNAGVTSGGTIIASSGVYTGDGNLYGVEAGVVIRDSGGREIATFNDTGLGTNNLAMGINAGNSIASGGNYNVCIGDEAGTALTTGDGNVAVGFEALATEDADGSNTAVGFQALKTLNAGATAYNTAVGSEAGELMTTGTQNTLVGALCGDAITDGEQMLR